MTESAVASTDARYLTFKSSGQLYALPAAAVAEVVRMLPVTRVPQAPRSLMGLANLRGTVLPVASLRALLGHDAADITQTSRLLVLEGAAPVALAVDDIVQLMPVAASSIGSGGADIASGDGEPLAGAFARMGEIVRILDIAALLQRGLARSTAAPRTKLSAAPISHAAAAGPARQRLLSFEVAGQDYALPLEAVREIVDAPPATTAMPGSDAAVRGVMPYRDGLLPLLSLRALLGLPLGAPEREKVVVVPVRGILIGFVTDRASAVLSADPDHIEPAPPVLAARAGGETQIREIYRAGGGRLISILSPDKLLRDEVMQRLTQGHDAMTVTTTEMATASELRFLVFRLDDSEFALPIDAVDEVARVPQQITRLPKTPKFLEGVVNLRGEVLPVIDQRRRFDMPPGDAGDARRLIVVRSERHRAGLIVDSVREVLRCSAEAIAPAPDLSGDVFGLVHSVINLDTSGRIVLLLDPSELLTRTERGLLDAFEQRAGKPAQQGEP